jgi:hypothetical protein
MKYVITENKMVDVLKKYNEKVLKISNENFYYSWTNFNCGMGECCDPYSIGFYPPGIDYDTPLFKLVMSENYDDDGDYPSYLSDDLPEECEEQPDITNPKFDTYIIEEELTEELNTTFGDSDIWAKSLMILLNNIFDIHAKHILIRNYNI